MATETVREQDYRQLPLIEPLVLPADGKNSSLSFYSYQEVRKQIQDIISKHHDAIEEALPTLRHRQLPEQARTLFGRFLEKRQQDALGLSFEIRSMTQELVQKNTQVAFYLRYVEEKKLYLVLGYRSFKDYAANYFTELEYSYLTRLKRISYMTPQEIKTFEPLGTTKMMLLAQLDKEQRTDILSKHFPIQENKKKTVDDMTTRELRKVVHKQKNPSYQSNLIKGIPSQLQHQLRLLEENLSTFDRAELEATKKILEQFLQRLDGYMG